MDLDPTTFLLEILNFVVLLWLLRRFLYLPVIAAIDRRRLQEQEAERALADRGEALDRRQQQIDRAGEELRLQREAALQAVAADVAATRARALADVENEAAEARAKAIARARAGEAQESQRLRALAARDAETFVRGFLQRLASAELERAIIRLFLSDIERIEPERARALRSAGSRGDDASIATAFDPSGSDRTAVEAALDRLLAEPRRWLWRVDPALICGIAVHLEAHSLEASLARGLGDFASTATGRDAGS